MDGNPGRFSAKIHGQGYSPCVREDLVLRTVIIPPSLMVKILAVEARVQIVQLLLNSVYEQRNGFHVAGIESLGAKTWWIMFIYLCICRALYCNVFLLIS